MKMHYQDQLIETTEPVITGNDLRIMRKLAGKTHTQVAQHLNVKSRKTVESWEASRTQPSISHFVTMALYLGFDPVKLVDVLVQRTLAAPILHGSYHIDWENLII